MLYVGRRKVNIFILETTDLHRDWSIKPRFYEKQWPRSGLGVENPDIFCPLYFSLVTYRSGLIYLILYRFIHAKSICDEWSTGRMWKWAMHIQAILVIYQHELMSSLRICTSWSLPNCLLCYWLVTFFTILRSVMRTAISVVVPRMNHLLDQLSRNFWLSTHLLCFQEVNPLSFDPVNSMIRRSLLWVSWVLVDEYIYST